jgi:hypothetical protein
MYVISVQRQHRRLNFLVGTVAKTLDDAGVAYRTLVPLKTRVVINVVDLSNELQSQVQSAARQMRSPAASFAGTGAFIGNDTARDQAQEVFEKEIKSYEAHHALNNLCRNDKVRRRRTRQSHATCPRIRRHHMNSGVPAEIPFDSTDRLALEALL